jgi:hypothetical protein
VGLLRALFERDHVTSGDFTREAQRFLAAVRGGKTDEKAAAAAGVSLTDAREWLRDQSFVDHYRRAKRGEGGPQIFGAADYLDPDPEKEVAWRRTLGERDGGVQRPAPWFELTPVNQAVHGAGGDWLERLIDGMFGGDDE